MAKINFRKARYAQKIRRSLHAAISGETHCLYCGNAFGIKVETPRGIIELMKTADHLVPKRAGGCDDPRNIVAACQLCNSIKKGMVFKELRGARKGISRGWLINKFKVVGA